MIVIKTTLPSKRVQQIVRANSMGHDFKKIEEKTEEDVFYNYAGKLSYDFCFKPAILLMFCGVKKDVVVVTFDPSKQHNHSTCLNFA